MTEAVNPKRTYNSPRRREQAAATRREILEAARRLFQKQGYAATTMAAIATEAGVALKTVYLAFETKSGVLRTLWNVTLRGDDGDVPIAEQAWYRETLDEPDPVRQLQLNARNSRRGQGARRRRRRDDPRPAPPPGSPSSSSSGRGSSSSTTRTSARSPRASPRRRRSALDVDRAADILWTINHPNTWQLLVGERGWTADQYEQWTVDTACRELLGPGVGSA